MASPRDIPVWLRAVINVIAFVGVGATLMGWVQKEFGIATLVFTPIYVGWEIYPWTVRQVKRSPRMMLAAFMVIGAGLGGIAWFAIREASKVGIPDSPSTSIATVKTQEDAPKPQETLPIARTATVSPHHITSTRRPSEDAKEPAQPLPVPEISAMFIQATSPGIVLFNRSQVVVHDPTCALQMWNLSKTPPITFPSFDAPQTNRFIKPGTGVVAASFDNPTMKPLLSDGDRIFGYVSADCPECKDTRFYWLYAVYNHPTESWYSEIPVGTSMNVFAIGHLLEQSKWDIDVFLSQVPHGPKRPAENGFNIKPH
jgi:hypothetical protein